MKPQPKTMMENNDTPEYEKLRDKLGDARIRLEASIQVRAKLRSRAKAAETELTALKARLAETEEDAASYIKTIGLIREAIGDNGKRMLPELVEYCRELAQKGGGE